MFITEKRESYSSLAGGSSGHYGHLADNVFHGSSAAGAAAALFGSVQHREGKISDIVPQKKTDGRVSVVTVKNHPDSPFYNPNHPVGAIGVAYKGRMDAKTIPNHDKVSFTPEDVKRHYGAGHHLTPTLTHLLAHAHKIHGNIPIIQHDVHTTTPKKDLEHKDGRLQWQPNTIRNYTTDQHEIKKIKKAKIIIASHTGFDHSFKMARGLSAERDVKSHPDVYNLNLEAPKISSEKLESHNKKIGRLLKNTQVRDSVDHIAKQSYSEYLERFTNNQVNNNQYGGENHPRLSHSAFRKFVSDHHDKEISKLKSEKGRQAKIKVKEQMLSDIDNDRSHLGRAFNLHHAFTRAVAHYVHRTHEADSQSPIKHELPDGKGSFKPAPFEGIVPRGKHPKINYQKFNDRVEFNRMNKISGEERFGPKTKLTEQTTEHAIVVPAARMQPFHRGHEALVNDAIQRAKKLNTTAHIYITQNKEGDERNPLSAEHRITLLHHAFKEHIESGHVKFHVGSGMLANLADFHEKNPHVKHAHVILGEDRMDVADTIKKYNGVKTKSKGYNFSSINVEQRQKTPSEHDNIHATELRNFANSDSSDREKFKFFRKRMHPNIPDRLIRSTIEHIRKTKKRLSFKEYVEYNSIDYLM